MNRSSALGVIVLTIALASTVPAVAAEYERWVPAAASNPGQYGTNWITDLFILNRSYDQISDVQVAFFPDAEGVTDPTEVSVTIEPYRMGEIRNVVAELFDQHRPGSLRLRSSKPFEAISRTYNDGGGDGTYGQGIPIVTPDDVHDYWALMGAANRPGPDGVRSNLGLMHTWPGDAEIKLILYIPSTDEVLEGVTVELGPYGWFQQDVFALFDIADRQVDSAIVYGHGDNNVFGYLSLVDNQTGDGSFIPPVLAILESTSPRRWDLTFTLSYSDGIEIYAIEHDQEGGYVIVPDPASGYSVDLRFTTPKDFCYTVLGNAGSGGGELEIDIHHGPVDDSGGGGGPTIGRGWSDAGRVRVEGCITMD